MTNIFMFIMIAIGLFLIIKHKNSKIYNFILCLFIILLLTYATTSTDSYAYEKAFKSISTGLNFEYINNLDFGLDIGYLIFMKFVSFLSNNYLFFRFLSAFLSILIIILAINKLEKNYNKNFILYFLFPFAFDSFQIEFFLAYSIIVYALVLLINNEKNCGTKFIILVIISSFIHKAAIVFIFLLFTKFVKKINFSKFIKNIYVPLIILFLIINIFFRMNVVKIFLDVFPIFDNFVGNYSTDKNLNIITIILSCSFFISLLYYSYLVRYYSDKTKRIFFMNCLSLIVLPMIFISLDFERLLRPQLIINYILFINTYNSSDLFKKKLIQFLIIIMILTKFFIHIGYYISNNTNLFN